MNVLLLNPPGPRNLYRDAFCSSISKANYVWKPRGHLMFSAVIPPEWKVHFIDASIRGLSADETVLRSMQFGPDIIVAAVSSILWDRDYDFLKLLRLNFPAVHLVAFGDALGEKYFFDQAVAIADEVVFNPFDYDITRHAERLVRSPWAGVSGNGAKRPRLITTYLPRHKLFDNTAYRWPFVKHFRYGAVYTQFGCPMGCLYCTSAKTPVTYRAAENILEEISLLHRDGYKELHFGDDTFGTPKENTAQILEGMLVRGQRFSWSAYTHPGVTDYAYLKLMRDSGCHTLVIGIDSHNFELLRKYGRTVTRERIASFIADCKKLGIAVCGDFMLGFEEEDEASVRKTIEFAVSTGVDYAAFNCVSPMVNTVIRDRKKEQGVIAESDFGFDTAGYRVLNTGKISSERLKELHSEAVRRFYFRPQYLLGQVFKVRSPEELVLRFIEGCGVFRNMVAAR